MTSDEGDCATLTSPGKHCVLKTNNALYIHIQKNYPKAVTDLVYWNNPIKSLIVLGSLLIVIRTFNIYRPHVVIAALIFAFTIVGIAIKLCFIAFKSVQHSEVTHPYVMVTGLCFSSLSEKDRDFASFCRPIENLLGHMRKIFMADDYVESLKYLVISYLTYTFNGFMPFHRILYFFIIVAFVIPMFYNQFEKQCDDASKTCRKFLAELSHLIDSKMPPKMKEKLGKIGLYPWKSKSN